MSKKKPIVPPVSESAPFKELAIKTGLRKPDANPSKRIVVRTKTRTEIYEEDH